MPKISVTIPSYNHEKYISEAIQSVLNQTFQDFEIIIVDDGSTDGTVDEIKKFTDSRIKLICFEKNQGACVAENRCIQESKGEYIAVLNSDDILDSEKLEKQVRFLDENQNIGAVFSYAQIIDEDGNNYTNDNHPYFKIFEQQNKNRFEWLNHFFYKGNCLCHPSILIRKKCYEDVGYYDERLAQLPDFDFWIRLCLKYEIHILPEKLVKFRIRQGEENASGFRPEASIRLNWELHEALNNFLTIKNNDLFNNIFPERISIIKDSEELIPFYIAMLALEVDSPVYKNFALHTLHFLMGDKNKVQLLRDNFNFTYSDYIKLTGDFDLYNLFSDSYTRVYIDTGDGFNSNELIMQRVIYNQKCFSLTFNLTNYSSIKSLRWDPVENKFSKVKIFSVTYFDSFAHEHNVNLSELTFNGEVNEEGFIVFETFDPKIFLPIAGEIISLTIVGEWIFIDNNEVLTNFNNLIKRQNDIILQQKNLLTKIQQTISWRITKPLRKVREIIRK